MNTDPTDDWLAGEPDEDAREPFLREGRELVETLAREVERLGGERPGAALEALAVLTHRLAGSASLYGLPEIASLAAAMERAVAALARGGGDRRERARRLLGEAVLALSGSLRAASRDPGAGSALPDSGQLEERLAALAVPAGDGLADRLRAFGAENPEVLDFFGPEAREQVEGLSAALAETAAGAAGQEPVERAFRLAHTLKGAAYMVECDPVGDLAHAMEDLLQPAREGRVALRGAVARALEDALDVLQRMLAALDGAAVAVEEPFREVRAHLALLAAEVREAPAAPAAAAPACAPTPAPAEDEPPAAAPAPEPPREISPAAALAAPRARSIRVDLGRIDQLMDLVGEAVIARGRLELLRERLGHVERLFGVSRRRMARVAEEIEQSHLTPDLSREESTREGRDAEARQAAYLEDFSELELDRYDALDLLMRQIAEISIDLGETETDLAAVSQGLSAELERSARLLKGLRTAVGRTRMLPLARLFERFRRRVERFAREEGRPLRFEVRGERVEVDTAIVERIADPLLHLINNALSHGLEGPAERRAAGKPEAATVALTASVHGVFVALEVEDDGRGLSAEELRRRAVELGLREEGEVARLSDAEALELIFLPGFSTALELSGLAGRGIGMDVVRAAVADLNGHLQIETLPGQGTRFTLRLPATLVVSTALGVRVGAEVLALPTLNVRRLVEVRQSTIEARDGREWVSLAGEELELIRLARDLGFEGDAARDPLPVVVVQILGRQVALAADELLGIEEVVVKDLGGFLAGLPGFSGVTVGADGRVILVLDPAGLPSLSPAARARELPAAPAPRLRSLSAESGAPRILLADDSVSVRKVLGRQLTAAGYEVTAVQDGEQALAVLRERPFAALITDLEMPRLNGFELLDLVRRRPASRDLPTVVITTRAGRKHREQAARLGATAYFSKPVDLEALLATLAVVTSPAKPPGAFAGTDAARRRRMEKR